MVWNFSLLPEGDHTVKVRLLNRAGQAKDLDARVTVIKFHGEFVEDMTPLEHWLYNQAVTIDGVTKNYDIRIEWSTPTQGFQITEITPR